MTNKPGAAMVFAKRVFLILAILFVVAYLRAAPRMP